MRRFVKYLAIFFLVILVILAFGMFSLGYVFDSKIGQAVSYVNRKQNHMVLGYQNISSSMLEKVGRVTVQIPKSKFGPVSMAFDVKTTFNFSSLDVKFKKVDNYGNLDELIGSAGLPLIEIKGAFSLSVFQMKAHGAVKTSAFSVPIEDGNCRIGENSVYISSRSTKKFNVDFASAGVKCHSDAVYDGKSALNLEFLDFKIKARPVIENKKVLLDKISVSFDSLNADASTIYLIGFKPTDHVKDPTLRDSIKVDNFNVNLRLSDEDKSGRRTLSSDGSVNLSWAFPKIKEGVDLGYKTISDLKYDFSFGKFSIEKLLLLLKDDKDPLQGLVKAVSNPLELDIDNLSFDYQGQPFEMKGQIEPVFDTKTAKISDLNAKIDFKASKALIDENIEEQYAQMIKDGLSSGAIELSSKGYTTTLMVKNKTVTLNGVSMNETESSADDSFDDASFEDEE